MTPNYFSYLSKRIKAKQATFGLIGIGYVGRALGETAAGKGFQVIGYSRTHERVKALNHEKIQHFWATNNFLELKKCDIIAVCVPTPIHKDKTPDLSPLIDSVTRLATILKPGQVVTIESSIAPGTTRNIVLPLLEKTGLTVEKDFFLVYSPERIDPGNSKYTFAKIPKVIAGYGPLSVKLGISFYKQLVKLFPVSTIEAAELTKMFENSFRLVNISFVNEFADYAKHLGLNMFEIIEAAKTKPFGFLAHYPGPGIGGHCIPVDPHYIRDDAMRRNIKIPLLEAACKASDMQPLKVVKQATVLLHKVKPTQEKLRVLLVGIAYKPDVADTRESPALTIWHKLEEAGIEVQYHDSYIPRYNGAKSLPLTKRTLAHYDLAIIITHHKKTDYTLLETGISPVLDTRNILKNGNGSVYQFHL